MYRLSCIALLLVACDPDDSAIGPDASTPDAAPIGQGGEATGALIVNEVAAKPASGPDWLELFNRSNAPVNLCDYFVTDSLDRLDHYHHLGGAPPPADCDPQLLDAGQYLVIFADDDVLAGPTHAPFKLGLADEAHVVSTAGEAVDSVVYLHSRDDDGLSLARQPNGEGLFWVAEPSQGSSNE